MTLLWDKNSRKGRHRFFVDRQSRPISAGRSIPNETLLQTRNVSQMSLDGQTEYQNYHRGNPSLLDLATITPTRWIPALSWVGSTGRAARRATADVSTAPTKRAHAKWCTTWPTLLWNRNSEIPETSRKHPMFDVLRIIWLSLVLVEYVLKKF